MIATHQKPLNSGFVAKSEPNDIMAGVDLSGKVAVVTGGYSGIGTETVRALAKAGAHVHVPARDVKRAQDTLDNIIPEDQVWHMDLSKIDTVRSYAKQLSENHPKIDIVIANAGVMACPLRRTTQGWEWQIGVNHFGHMALILGLLDALKNAEGARVVALSSIAHRAGGIMFDDMHFEHSEYDKWRSYGQSKTATSLLAVAMNQKYAQDGIEAYGVHPGGIFTPLQRHLENAEMAAFGWTDEKGNPTELARQHFKTPAQGATTSLWCAVSPQLTGLGGVYCEDCNIAEIVPDDDKGVRGVRSWAIDSQAAEKLWDVTTAALSSA